MINPHDPCKPGGYTDWKDHAQKYGDWGGFQNTTHFGSAKPFTLPPAQNPTYGSSGNITPGSTVPYSRPSSIAGTPSIASGGVSYGRRWSGAGLFDDLHPLKWAMAGCIIGLLACFLSQRDAPNYAGAAIAGLVGFPLLALGLRIATLLLMGLFWLFQLALKVAVVLGIIWIGWSLIQGNSSGSRQVSGATHDSSNPSNAVASLPDALAAADPSAAAAPMSAQQWPDGRALQFPGTSSLCRVYNVEFDDSLKLRAGPGASSDIITTLPPTARSVRVYTRDWEKNEQDVWFCVSWHGHKGYLMQKFLTPQ